jgi:hypothetical protein
MHRKCCAFDTPVDSLRSHVSSWCSGELSVISCFLWFVIVFFLFLFSTCGALCCISHIFTVFKKFVQSHALIFALVLGCDSPCVFFFIFYLLHPLKMSVQLGYYEVLFLNFIWLKSCVHKMHYIQKLVILSSLYFLLCISASQSHSSIH